MANSSRRYTPNDTPLGTSKPSKRSRTAPPSAGITGNRFVEILDSWYKPVSSVDGIWKGKLKGNGKIALELQIYRNGALEVTRSMGETILDNTSTTFTFVSAPPRGEGWTWNIVGRVS